MRARVVDESRDERTRNLLDQVDAFCRRADLARVQKPRPGHAGHRHLQIGILEDDARIDAAELEVDARESCGGFGRDARAHRRRSGERNAGHVGVLDERIADVGAGAGHDVGDAGRQVRHRALRHSQRGQRRQLRRLHDHGVAGGDRRRHLPRHQQERIVERGDAGHDAQRLLDGEVHLVLGDRRDRRAVRVSRDLGVVIEAGRTPFHFVQVLDSGLAAFARQQLREPGAILAQRGRDLMQQARPLDRGDTPPPRLRGHAARHRALNVGRRRFGNRIDGLERGRIGDDARASSGRIRRLAVNPQLCHRAIVLSLAGSRLSTLGQSAALGCRL